MEVVVAIVVLVVLVRVDVGCGRLTLPVVVVVPPLRVFPDLGGGLKDPPGIVRAALGFFHRNG